MKNRAVSVDKHSGEANEKRSEFCLSPTRSPDRTEPEPEERRRFPKDRIGFLRQGLRQPLSAASFLRVTKTHSGSSSQNNESGPQINLRPCGTRNLHETGTQRPPSATRLLWLVWRPSSSSFGFPAVFAFEVFMNVGASL